MLTAAEAVEAELMKKGAPGTSALAVSAEEPQPLEDLDELTRQVVNLTEAVSAIASSSKKPFDFSKIKCYRCGRYGHFQNRCTNENRKSGGPNKRLPHQTRRSTNQAFRRPGRAQFALEDAEAPVVSEEEEEEDASNEEESDVQWTSGN